MLEKEGFAYKNYVDIFDAGPTVEVQAKDITTIKESKNLVVKIEHSIASPRNYMVANCLLADFRCAYVNAQEANGTLMLSLDDARKLKLDEGDTVRAYATGK
jgi:arginine N-succinyltransferase